MDKNCDRRGFTLIELLVVVLIIGVLAAIALPQYLRSVEKAKAAEALSLMRPLINAMESHYLATQSYTTDPAQLDVSVTETKHYAIEFVPPTDSSDFTHNILMYKKGGTYENPTFRYVARYGTSKNFGGKLMCISYPGVGEGNALCQALGGAYIGSYTPIGWSAYLL